MKSLQQDYSVSALPSDSIDNNSVEMIKLHGEIEDFNLKTRRKSDFFKEFFVITAEKPKKFQINICKKNMSLTKNLSEKEELTWKIQKEPADKH